MKTTSLKSLAIAFFCLISIQANAQISNGLTKAAISAFLTGRAFYKNDYRQYMPKDIDHTPFITPSTQITPRIVPTVGYRPQYNIKTIMTYLKSLAEIRENQTLKTFIKGLNCLEQRDTLGAITHFETIKSEFPRVLGLLGQLQCQYYGKEMHFKASLNLIRAAFLGDTKAAKFLGLANLYGNYYFGKHKELALHYLNIAAKSGDTLSTIKRDMLLIEKDSVDTEKTFPVWTAYYRDAVEKKNNAMLDDMCLHLAYMGIHKYGTATTTDGKAEAWNYVMEAATRNEPHACMFASNIYSNGDDYISQDLDSMQTYIEKAAEAGYIEANLILARAGYESGDYEMCIRYGKNEAFADSIEIQRMLADSYYNLKQYDEALSKYKSLESCNDTNVYFNIYKLYDKIGVKDSSLVYLEKAAMNGCTEACNLMAVEKFYPIETRNLDATIYWLEKAAEKNDAGALSFLGDIYSDKKLKRVDKIRAAEYYRRGAELGNYNATFRYAWCLQKGYGVKKDKKLARHYYELAEKMIEQYN